jgi:hypothetical protein
MEQISFREWTLRASIIDTDVLRLEIESSDDSDIIETGNTGRGVTQGGEPYGLHFTTERLEEAHSRPTRQASARQEADADGEEPGPGWLSDEEETLYLRAWEVNALVDEDGMLNVQVGRSDDAGIYEEEPLESAIPLSSRVVVRLAAEEEVEEGEEEGEEDELEHDYDEEEDFEELGELDDDYDHGGDEDELGPEDLYDQEEDVY